MPYTVDFTDGLKSPLVVADGTVNTETDITLVGKNYARYGEIIAENLLHLLENFSGTQSPDNPIEGQLWYDSDNNMLKYFDDRASAGGIWKSLATLIVSSTAPTHEIAEGTLWMDSDGTGVIGKVYIYYSGQWLPFQMANPNNGVVYEQVLDTALVTHNVLKVSANGVLVGIISSDTTDWIPNYDVSGGTAEYSLDGITLLKNEFPVVKAGYNLNVTGNAFVYHGTATSAQYADLAERYAADAVYDYGTVVELGGAKEITVCTHDMCDRVFGVISVKPGLMLNALAGDNNTHPFVALAGRVPCKVVGTVNKGDRLVTTSEYPGHARAAAPDDHYGYQHVVGRALESKINREPGLIEIVVGAK